jgi:hypothetical protein
MDSFLELPQKKRPPKNIIHNEYQLNEWFEEVFDEDNSPSQDDGGIVIDLGDVD